jgi:hypothetical protein
MIDFKRARLRGSDYVNGLGFELQFGFVARQQAEFEPLLQRFTPLP